MREILHQAWILVAGALIGSVFFGGLHWTVHRAIALPVPGLWFFASSILRTIFALAGFWMVTDRNWQSMLVCLVGFVAARLAVVWWTRVVPKMEAVATSPEVRDAP